MALENKTITVRLPSALYAQILMVAENTNANLAEATRNCLSEHFNHIKIEAQLDTINIKLDAISKTLEEV
jgi:hypothetical protein